MISFVLTCFLLIGSAVAVEVEFSYLAQDEWPPICVAGNQMRQSPIDILTEDVTENKNLIDLQLSGWETGYDGNFINTGHALQFNPTTVGLATTRNHLGTYQLQQVHMHWGRITGEGSEHLVNGNANELEIHFVHSNEGVSGNLTYMVIGVMAKVDEDARITGPWLQLNATAVQEDDSSLSVMGFSFDQFLPLKRDYYYYEGSFTAPICSEIVAWFMLKDTITVPGTYLQQLRQTKGINGTPLDFNFREPQAIGSRVVYQSSQAAIKPIASLLIICLIMIRLY